MTRSHTQNQLSNVCSIMGWGFVAAIPIGMVFGLISRSGIYLIVLFPAIMGYIVALGAQKGIRIARLPFALIIIISVVLSISTYAAMFFVDYEFFKREMASAIDHKIIREFGVELDQPMEELREARETKQYRQLRRALVSDMLETETGYSGFIGYLIFRVRTGEEIGFVISRQGADLGSQGTIALWIVEMIIIAIMVERRLKKRCSAS